MAKSCIITALLLLSLTAVARTQYIDILQGLQQLLQPYQQQNNGDVSWYTTNRRPNKPEQRKKNPTLNQFDIFGTTTKPSRKTTKIPIQTKVVNDNRGSNKNRNPYTDFAPSNYEITTKSNRDKPTTRTTVHNNRGLYTTSTTENVINFNSNNRGASSFNTRTDSENIDNKHNEKYTVGTTYDTNSNFNNRPTTYNNRNTNDFSSTSNQNRPNNNEGITNNRSNNRNVNVANLDDRRSDIVNTGAVIKTRNVNTDFYWQDTPNFGFVNQNPSFNKPATTSSPVIDNIFFPNNEGFAQPQTPELLIGPNEDGMTSLQRRRYVDLAERMCERYKALNIRQLVALPPSLVPSPAPVEFNVSSCNPSSIPLIIGGKIVDITEFPHMALLGWKKIGIAGYSWKCGGSLVSDKYVLTAGHCTYQDTDSQAESGLAQVIQLGSSYLDDPGAQVVKIASIIRHPKYKRSRAYHDVALAKMVKRVSFSEVIKPACIGLAPSVGENIIATGWGRTEFGGDHSNDLRSVSLPIWDMGECRTVWQPSVRLPNGPTPDSHVCAGDRRGGKDTCQGDSGGPAQVQDGCVWRVVAVTSIGKSCATPHTPALYAVIPRAFVAAQVFGEDVDYGGRGTANSNRRGEEYYRLR